jgi:hypothetical protein
VSTSKARKKVQTALHPVAIPSVIYDAATDSVARVAGATKCMFANGAN